MRRVVYTPRVWAYIKRGKSRSSIVDISDYIVSGSVERRLNAVSSAQLTIRNPNRIWTDPPGDPKFRPMMPITIWMMRRPGIPVQVFTGYLDRTPLYPLYPGTVTLFASCTLKKLLHTYFDPALPYTQQFMMQYGWIPDQRSGMMINIPAELPKLGRTGYLNDSGIGSLLYATLEHIGHWKSRDIYIEQLPRSLSRRLAKTFRQFRDDNEAAREDFKTFLETYLGSGSYGEGSESNDPSLRGGPNVEKAFNYLRDKGFNSVQAAGAVGSMMQESGTSLSPTATNPSSGAYGIAQWLGGRKDGLMRLPNYDSLGTQLRYLWSELMGPENVAYQMMKNAASVEEAVGIWTIKFERPGAHEQVLQTRINYAKSVLSQYANNKPSSSSDDDDQEGHTFEERPGNSNTGQNAPGSTSGPSNTLYSPVKGLQPGEFAQGGGAYGAPRSYGGHAGVDANSSRGQTWYSICDGTVVAASSDWTEGSGVVIIKSTQKIANYPDGVKIGYGGSDSNLVSVGDKVKAGQAIATCGTHGSGPHLHFFATDPDSSSQNGTMDPTPLLAAAVRGEQPTGGPGGVGGGGVTDEGENATAAAFASTISAPSIMEMSESLLMQGQKSLMNDKPLFPFVEQLASASLRSFQSLPDGRFFAFYPDYFGEYDEDGEDEPYLKIYDEEILDGTIELNDEEVKTHVYVVGDTIPFGGIGLPERLLSSGVVTIFNAFNAGKDDKEKSFIEDFDGKDGRKAALDFLKKYGARPDLHEAPMIRSPYFELFLAWQRFMLAWSRQFNTDFTFTFMPELYPGGKVGFPDHGIKMYIESVTHSFDYAGGFTTTGTLTAPSAYGHENKAISRGLVADSI
jgi:murein DD-endopeptidase MepM/ murein hydrolase activator NlpD